MKEKKSWSKYVERQWLNNKRNAYGTDSGSSDEEHKASSIESIDDLEQQKKKMIWERIQKQVETEEEEENKVDKGKDEELEDDEEYIYM